MLGGGLVVVGVLSCLGESLYHLFYILDHLWLYMVLGHFPKRTFSREDFFQGTFSREDIFQGWTFSREDIFQRGHFPDWTFSRGHFPERIISRMDFFQRGNFSGGKFEF